MKKRTLSLLLAVICLFALTAGMLSGCVGTKLQVSFDLNYEGAPEAPTAIKVKAGKTYGKLPAVTVQREGYTFVGWCLDADGEELVTSETKVTMKSDHTLYAKWEGQEYTVSYDLQGGNINGVTTVESTTVKVGNVYSMMAIPDDPEKDNHTFLGWYYDAEGTQGPVTASTKVVKTCDHTLYAKWKENQLLYDFEQIEDISAFNNRGNGLSFNAVAYGESNQLMIQNPNEGKSDNFLVMWAELKAGTRVTMDVTFTGELTKGARMHLFCYGANIVGDPITTGVINKTLSDNHRKWYDGNGYRAKQENGAWFYGDENDWHKGNTVTIDFVVMEDCSGLTLWVNLGSNMEPAQWAKNAIYIDNIQFTPGYQEITDADKGGVEQKPQEETQGEENFPFTFECGSVDSDVFKLRDSNLNMSVVKRGGSQQLKLQLSTANGKNWLWLNKPLKAGTKVTFDVTFDNAGTGASMSIFGYGSQTNGDPISVKPAGSNINIQWYHGQGVKANSGKHTVEINVYEACSGISLMLGFDGNPETVIYLDNFRLGKMSEDQAQTSGETNFPFTFECGSVDSDIFKLRDSDLKMSVKSFDNSKQLVIQPTKADGKYWLWLNKNLKAGHKVTFDVTFDRGSTSGGMSIFAYGSKTNGDPITEGTPTDTIPQSWFWGQGVNADFSGGNTNKQTITITAYQPCNGISLMLGMQSNTTIYIDNVTLDTSGEIEEEPSEPDEPDPPAADAETESPFTFDGGAFSADIFNNRNGGLSVSVENKQLKLQQPEGASNWLWIKQDMKAGTVVTMDVTFSGEGMSIHGYGSKENGDPITEGTVTESVPQGWFWGQGGSENGSYTFTIYEDCYGLSLMLGFAGSTETAIYIDNVVITVPQVDVGVEETESPFTFDGGAFSADIFNNRNNGPTVSVENKQLKLQLPAGAPNWLWIKQDMKAGTVVTMDVTFSGEGMSIHGYGSKENGDPITEGTVTESVPQGWFWGQGGSENGSYTFTIYEDCYGLSLMLGFAGSTETAIYIDNVVITVPQVDVGVEETESPFTFDGGAFSADIFNNRNNGPTVSVENKQLKLQLPAGAPNWLWIKQDMKAGTVVTMDVTFSGEGMSIHGYGSKENGDPITEGTATESVPQEWFWGQGGSENGSYTFTIYEDCYGLSLMLGFAGSTETAIYIDNVVITAPEPSTSYDVGVLQDSAHGAGDSGIYFTTAEANDAPWGDWNTYYDTANEDCLKLVRNGQIISVGLTGRNTICKFGANDYYLRLENHTIGEYAPFTTDDMFIVEGAYTHVNSGTTLNIAKTYIYHDGSAWVFSATEPAKGPETESPFTFDDGVFSADIFNNRNNGPTVSVENKQLKLQLPAGAPNWLWIKQDMKAGTVVTMDVTFSGEGMSIHGYGSKENGDPITEGTATESVPQEWFWGQGGSENGSYTFTIYEDCYGLSLMLGFAGSTETAIYIDNVVITAPEPSTSYDVGVLQDSAHGAGDSGIYFTTAEANDAPWGDWNTYYDTANEDCLKLVRNGQIISVGLTGRNTICKFGANDYYLRLENYTIGEYAPFTTDDMFIVEGAYTHVNSGTTLNIAKTYIYHDGSAWVFSATEPAKGPETESPFTFDDGVFSADIFNNRNNGPTVSVENKQLKLQLPAGAPNWLWIKQDMKAGTVVTMDVTFSGEGMSIHGYGSKENGDPITEGTVTESVPQGWFWGQGGSENGSYTFTIYEDCYGLSLMLGFAGSTETAIYIDNVVITKPQAEEPPEEIDPPATGDEADFPFTFDDGVASEEVFKLRDSDLEMTVAEQDGSQQLKLQPTATTGNYWLWLNKPLKAGTVITVDVTFERKLGTMGVYLYGAKENGDPITEGTATDQIPQSWYDGQGASFATGDPTTQTVTFTVYEDCHGISFMLDFNKKKHNIIYLDNIQIAEQDDEEPTAETVSPFTFDDGVFSADIFNNRNNGPTVSVENKQLKLQLPAGAPNWLWLKQEMKAGTVITMDVAFSGEGMNIFGYGSKANGDPITEGTATESVPQEWFWGQGGSENGSYTFTIYEDCYGLSLMLGFAGSTETAVYLDNIVITEP